MKNTHHRVAIIALALTVCTVVNKAEAYMAMRVAITSNLLVYHDRVYFTQTDHGMTVLDLATGKIIMRKHDKQYHGHMWLHPRGIVINGWQGTSLLDADTLESIWTVQGGYPEYVSETCFLSCDDDNQIKRLDLDTGDVLWTLRLTADPHLIVAGERALIVCRSYSNHYTKLLLVDLKSGKVLYERLPKEDESFEEVYFDGERTYVLACTDSVRDDEQANSNQHRSGMNRAVPDALLIIDTTGSVIETVTEVPIDVGNNGYYSRVFSYAGMVFQEDGHVVPFEQYVDTTGPGTVFSLPDGMLTIEQVADSKSSSLAVAAWQSDTAQWRAYLPHMDGRWSVTDAVSDRGFVVLGTDRGVVECIDSTSGRSQWLYTFPTHLGTVSYTSPNGMPPHATSLQAGFERDNRLALKTRPAVLLPAEWDMNQLSPDKLRSLPGNTSSLIVLDPDPFDPFDWLPPYVRAVWGAVTLTVLLSLGLCLLLYRGRRRFMTFALSSIVLAWLPIAALYYLGRVSWPATLCLKLFVLILLVLSVVHIVRALIERHGVGRVFMGGLTFVIVMVAGYYALPVLRYA